MFVTFTEPVCNLVEQRKGLAPNCAVPVDKSVGFSFLGVKSWFQSNFAVAVRLSPVFGKSRKPKESSLL